MRRLLTGAGLLLLLATAACGGSTDRTTVENRMVTQEQELKDLRRALDVGAISEEEYQDQRAKLLGDDD